MGRALAATLNRQQILEASNILNRALEYYVASGDLSQAVVVGEFPLLDFYDSPGQLARHLFRALEAVPADSYDAARLLIRYGAYLGRSEGDYEGAQAAFNSSLEIARRDGDSALEMRALEAAGAVAYAHLRYPECLENNLRAIMIARRLNSRRRGARSGLRR